MGKREISEELDRLATEMEKAASPSAWTKKPAAPVDSRPFAARIRKLAGELRREAGPPTKLEFAAPPAFAKKE